MKIGEAIRSARKRKGLTLVQIQHQLGLSHSAISQIENGKTNASRRTLIDLARVLDDNFGLEWLEDYRVTPPDSPSLEDQLRSVIREIVREEIRAASVQDLGTIDEYLADQLKKSDNPSHVLTNWYERDGVEPNADLSTLTFSDWAKMSADEKIEELKATRRVVDKQQEFRNHVPPKDSQ